MIFRSIRKRLEQAFTRRDDFNVLRFLMEERDRRIDALVEQQARTDLLAQAADRARVDIDLLRSGMEEGSQRIDSFHELLAQLRSRVEETDRKIDALVEQQARTDLLAQAADRARVDIDLLRSCMEEGGQRIDSFHEQLTQLHRQAEINDRSQRAFGEQIKEITLGANAIEASVDAAMRNTDAAQSECARLCGTIARIGTSGQLSLLALHDIACSLAGYLEDFSRSSSTVGVVIPTCDRPRELRRAITSVAMQSRTPNHIVVVNDGNTPIDDVVAAFAGRLSIATLKTAKPYSGSSVARNLALDILQTDFIAFLDDDNIMWPRWIERASNLLEGDPKLAILYGAQLRGTNSSATVKDWFLVPFDLDRLKQGNFIDLNQVIHRSSKVRFDPHLRRLVDWDYILRLVGSKTNIITWVEAISSIYLTSATNRISVNHWPPDLGKSIVARESGIDYPSTSGSRVCSCCGFVGEFAPGPNQRPDASCPNCGSLERHRFLQLVGPFLRDFWLPQTRISTSATIIEVAPSRATNSFRNLFCTAMTIDAYPDADERSVEVVASLTDLPIPDGYAEVIVALHVLEHIPNDRKALIEIARTLSPTGVAILQVPMSSLDVTDEEVLAAAEDRLARYGQADHVRLYGSDFYTRLTDSGLTSAAVNPQESMRPESIVKYGLSPHEVLVFAVRSDWANATARLNEFVSSLLSGSRVGLPS